MTDSASSSPIPADLLDRVDYRHFHSTNKAIIVKGCGFLGRPNQHEDALDCAATCVSASYVLSGNGVYVDWHGIEQTFVAGDVFLRFPGKRHSTTVTRDGSFALVCFGLQPTFSQSLLEIGYVDPERPVLHPGISMALLDKFIALYENFCQLPKFDARIITNQAMDILTDIYALDASRDSELEAVMHRATMLLSEDLHLDLDVKEVAGRLGMSYHWFRKLFRKHQGISPHNYRIQRRLQAACDLLVTQRLSIKQTAHALGYPYVSAFARQFKKAYGIAPGAYVKSVVPGIL